MSIFEIMKDLTKLNSFEMNHSTKVWETIKYNFNANLKTQYIKQNETINNAITSLDKIVFWIWNWKESYYYKFTSWEIVKSWTIEKISVVVNDVAY